MYRSWISSRGKCGIEPKVININRGIEQQLKMGYFVGMKSKVNRKQNETVSGKEQAAHFLADITAVSADLQSSISSHRRPSAGPGLDYN